MFQCVCEVEQSVVECGPCDHGSVRQAVTGLEVFGVGERLGQVFRHKADSLSSQQDGQRVGCNGSGRFDDVVYRVDGHIAGLLRREFDHQARIVDGEQGIEAVIGDGWLVVVLRNAGHGEAVDFAARAVGQVDDNNGDSLCRREREGIQLFRRLAWIGKDNGRAFARIDGAAAADAEYGLGIGGSAEGRRLVYGVGCGVGSHLVVQGDAYAVLGAGCGDVIPCAGKLVGMPAGHAKDGVDASGLQIGGDVINLGDGSDSKIGRCLCADFLNITLIESSIPHGGLLYGKQIRLSNQTNCSFIHN